MNYVQKAIKSWKIEIQIRGNVEPMSRILLIYCQTQSCLTSTLKIDVNTAFEKKKILPKFKQSAKTDSRIIAFFKQLDQRFPIFSRGPINLGVGLLSIPCFPDNKTCPIIRPSIIFKDDSNISLTLKISPSWLVTTKLP